MNRSLLPTERPGIFYSMGNEKHRVRVRLYDAHGNYIHRTTTSHSYRPGESTDVAVSCALYSAFQKLDRLIAEINPDSQPKQQFFSAHWTKLSNPQKLLCAGAASTASVSTVPIITYFERNVLPLLDGYGADITPLQCKEIAKELLYATCHRKLFGRILTDREKAEPVISAFFETLAGALGTHYPKSKALHSAHLSALRDAALADDRLRSLLHHYLLGVGTDAAVNAALEKIASEDNLARTLRKDPERKSVSANRRAEDEAAAADGLTRIIWLLAGNEAELKRQLNNRLPAINRILQGMALSCGDDFPVIELPLFEDAQRYQTESRKTLTNAQRLTFARLMFRRAAASSFAVGALMMLTIGPRPEELCAITFGQVLDRGAYGVVSIQATNRRKTIGPEGKNQYFAHNIFLTSAVMAALRQRRAHLLALGYTQEQVNSAYIVCDSADPMQPVYPATFSTSVREVLTKCGCNQELWAEVEQTRQIYAPEMDPVAYFLRHDAISVMVNHTGMDPLLVDALVGHSLPTNSPDWAAYIRDEDKWPEIVAQMERFVYIPEHSMHPCFHPLELERNSVQLPLPVQEFSLHVKKGRKYRVTYTAPRGTDMVHANLPKGSGFAFEAAAPSSPCPPFLLLPLSPAADHRRAETEAANLDDCADRKTP